MSPGGLLLSSLIKPRDMKNHTDLSSRMEGSQGIVGVL